MAIATTSAPAKAVVISTGQEGPLEPRDVEGTDRGEHADERVRSLAVEHPDQHVGSRGNSPAGRNAGRGAWTVRPVTMSITAATIITNGNERNRIPRR